MHSQRKTNIKQTILTQGLDEFGKVEQDIEDLT